MTSGTSASSRASACDPAPSSSASTSTAPGVRSTARSKSRHITLPEPSQIELTGSSRKMRGSTQSST